MKSNPFTKVAHRLPPSPVDQSHGNGRYGRGGADGLPQGQVGRDEGKLLDHLSPMPSVGTIRKTCWGVRPAPPPVMRSGPRRLSIRRRALRA